MCFKSTSVTEQTLYLPRMQTALCISLPPFFIFKTYAPLFLICGNAKRKSKHKKFWKKIGGAGGKERTFFKRFFLSPAGKVPRRRTSASVTVGCRFVLEPPASAPLRRGKPAGILQYFHSIQYLGIPCASNPPMLPCKHSTFSEYKQFLAFPFRPSSFSKLMPRFFLFAETQKEKASG